MDTRAEQVFGGKVAPEASCRGEGVMLTTIEVPVMTRLLPTERRVLDTLIAAGVAGSRSEALAWCVELSARTRLRGWTSCIGR
jgi:hypothetical protein